MSFFKDIVEWLETGLNNILAVLVSVLPDSPFSVSLPSEVTQFLGYLNYFIPFDKLEVITNVWVGAVVAYYIVQTMLRWAKAIE